MSRARRPAVAVFARRSSPIQVALSLVLLAGTGLFLRSLVHSLRVPLGFTVDGVATASVNLGSARYDAARANAFYDEAIARVHALPGVTSAAWTSLVPTNGAHVITTTVEGYTPRADEDVIFYVSSVGPEYFQAAGTRLLRGRAFIADDFTSAQGVAIINETAARRYWAGRDPLGGRIEAGDKQWIQVVGIVEDTKVEDLDEEPAPYVYQPFAHGASATRSIPRICSCARAATPNRSSARSTLSCAPRSRRSRLRGEHVRLARAAARDAAAHGRHAVRRLQRARADARRDWHLRRRVVRRRAPHARDRDSHRARRRPRADPDARCCGKDRARSSPG